jgi:putative serine protease PepD
MPGGPAAKAGLKSGDIITEIGGRAITSPEELIVAVRAHNVGDTVIVKYKRGNSTGSVTLTLTASK